MHNAPSLYGTHKAAAVRAEIEASRSVHVSVTTSDELLILHHIAEPVGEFWDIAYGNQMSTEEHLELVDLFLGIGRPMDEVTVESEEFHRPHPQFVASTSFTFVRVCLKVAQ